MQYLLLRTDTLQKMDAGAPNDHDKGLWLTVVLGITRVARTVMSYNEDGTHPG